MSSDPLMPQTYSPAAAAKAAGQAAMNAIASAAINAAQPGQKSSEFKVVVGGVLLSGLVAGLHALSVIPGPWMLPAVLISTTLMGAAYATSRGNVKSAALRTAANALVYANSVPPPPPPAQG